MSNRITRLKPAPNSATSVNFNETADEFVKSLEPFPDQANALADEVETNATNAKTSETNAKESETNAKESEENAKTSETNAKESETNAKTSETIVTQSESRIAIIANRLDQAGGALDRMEELVQEGFIPDNLLKLENGKIPDAKLSEKVVLKNEEGKIADELLPDNTVKTTEVPSEAKSFTYPETEQGLYNQISKLVPYLNIHHKNDNGSYLANVTSNEIDFDLGINFICTKESFNEDNITFTCSNENQIRNLGKSGLIFVENIITGFDAKFKILNPDSFETKSKALFSYFINPLDYKVYLSYSGVVQ